MYIVSFGYYVYIESFKIFIFVSQHIENGVLSYSSIVFVLIWLLHRCLEFAVRSGLYDILAKNNEFYIKIAWFSSEYELQQYFVIGFIFSKRFNRISCI